MPTYRFAIHRGAAETEMLGTIELCDDVAALDFAKRLIHDMPDKDRTQGDGRSVDITDGKRAVGRICCCAHPEA
jgi:hypothetical protein